MGLWKHPGIIAGVCVALGMLAMWQQIDTNKRVTKVEKHVEVINHSSPCTGLTTSECAIKLLRALPSSQRRALRVTEGTILRLERQAQRERRRLDSGQTVRGANGQSIAGKRDSGASPSSPSQPRRPRPRPSQPSRPSSSGSSGGGNGGNSGGGSGGGSPPPSKPVVQTPSVTVPATPVTPTLTVPSITVPCTETAVTHC